VRVVRCFVTPLHNVIINVDDEMLWDPSQHLVIIAVIAEWRVGTNDNSQTNQVFIINKIEIW